MCLIHFTLPLAAFVDVEIVEPEDGIHGLLHGGEPPNKNVKPTLIFAWVRKHYSGKLLRFRVNIRSPYRVCFMLLLSIPSKLHKFQRLHLRSSALLYMSFSSDRWVRYLGGDGTGTWEWMKMYKTLSGLGSELMPCHLCCYAISQSKVTRPSWKSRGGEILSTHDKSMEMVWS